MALKHVNCLGFLYHSWRNKHEWVNEHGRRFELGSWWCYKCGKEILSQDDMKYVDDNLPNKPLNPTTKDVAG